MELADFREFFDGLERGVLGQTVDTAHLARSGVEDLPGFIDEFGAFVDNLDLKDYSVPMGRDGEWRVAGEGVLDLGGRGVLAALARAGYDGWICVTRRVRRRWRRGCGGRWGGWGSTRRPRRRIRRRAVGSVATTGRMMIACSLQTQVSTAGGENQRAGSKFRLTKSA